MTACVNRKHTKKVAAVVTASLVGALSLGVAPVAAMATDSVDMLADPSDVWEGIQLTWNVEADPVNGYTIQTGDQFLLASATDAFGNPVSMSDLTVIYYSDNGSVSGKLDDDDFVWNVTPSGKGDYIALVIDGKLDTSNWTNGTRVGATAAKINAMNTAPVEFSIEAKSLEGAFAYEKDNVSDTTFKFTGADKVVNFADADGNKLELGVDYKINQKSFTGDVREAGIPRMNHRHDGAGS